MRLHVNIDHVATLRQARGTKYPDPVWAATLCELAGAHGITCHLREDRRHINDRDLTLLRQTVRSLLNLEMAATDEMLAIAERVRPDLVTLVPERRAERTTEGGLDVVGGGEELARAVARLQTAGMPVSLFIDPDQAQVRASANVGARTVELHTGHYCEAAGDVAAGELERLAGAADLAMSLGLKVAAGHGLDYANVGPVARLPAVEELNIGHALIARAVLVGLDRAVRDMLALLVWLANMLLVTGEEMRALDRAAIEDIGLPAFLLMEHAGRAVADEVASLAKPGATVAVVCGSGNNGGDGFVCARWLRERGYAATVVLAGGRPRTPEAQEHLALYQKLGGTLAPPGPLGHEVIVDALLGNGVTREVSAEYAALIDAMNRAPGVRIAVDVPSGMDSDTGKTWGAGVRADRTVTLGFAKIGLVSHPGCELAGVLRVADIGIPRALAASARAALLDDDAVRALVPRRSLGGHKGSHGHVLVCAGSPDKVGAALLCASGALRAGAGLVTLATTADAAPLAAGKVPEVMVTSGDVVALARGKRVVVWGPGMPTDEAAGDALRAGLAALDLPLVLDADALNHLARDPSVIAAVKGGVVLTPHPGEAARLLGVDTAAVQADRVGAARRLAELTRAVVVLKGARTVVARADGVVAINPTGNPGMGTGGTGDVLAGVIGALVAQGLAPWDAARAGVYLHGRAGDLAAAASGQVGLIASDLLAQLPVALRTI